MPTRFGPTIEEVEILAEKILTDYMAQPTRLDRKLSQCSLSDLSQRNLISNEDYYAFLNFSETRRWLREYLRRRGH